MNERIQLSDHFSMGRLLRFTMPTIGTMVFMSVYSVVDGFFVSNFAGKTCFSAVNLIFPFIMILQTVGLMFGTGGSALVAKTFGEGDNERGNEYFSLFVYVVAALGIFFAVLGFVFMRPIASFLGGEGELLDNAVLYGRMLMISLPFCVLSMVFQSFYATAEMPNLGLRVTLLSGCTNIVLDAVLVTTLPQAYKLAGAALATVISQILSGSVPLVYFSRKNPSILRLGRAHFDAKAVLKAATNGSSEFMSNISMNLVSMLYNHQLLRYAGQDGIAAYGVMMYVSTIFSAAFVGYSIGNAPVIGYHYGAQNYDELKSLRKTGFTLIGTFGVVMLAAAEALAAPLSKFFVGYDAELCALTVSGFRIFSLSFLFMGFAIYSSGFFTALNDGLTSALISFLRTLVFQMAAVLLLPQIFGIQGIWYSIVVAEVMAVLLSLGFLIGKQKKYHY